MTFRIRSIAFALAFGAAVVAPAAAQEYQVIVNEAVPASSLGETELARVFQRAATRWPNGIVAEPVDQADGSSIREKFTEDMFHKTAAQMHAWWQTQIFSGTTVPPVVIPTESQVIQFVQGHAGAVAYIAASTPLPQGVKRLRVAR